MDTRESKAHECTLEKQRRKPKSATVAQYQTMVKLFTDATDLYRYAAEPSRQVALTQRMGEFALWGSTISTSS